MDYSVFEEFCKQIGATVSKNEPMSNHSGFKTGGNADLFIAVKNEEMLKTVLETAKALQVPVFILGKGSNLLVSDKGIEGAVISLKELSEIKIEDTVVTAGAGASLTALCVACAGAGLSGLEFAYGIPGSVGGALYMNAGAYGGEMSQVVSSARYVTPEGESVVIDSSQMNLGYRKSVFKENENAITEVSFELTKKPKAEIKAKMDELMEKRRSKQPLEYPSGGSTFKRPEGYFAGALIEENGLKGARVGGAMVSEKHAGFIINYHNATTNDILELMERVKAAVLEKNGVLLEPEVIFKGRK